MYACIPGSLANRPGSYYRLDSWRPPRVRENSGKSFDIGMLNGVTGVGQQPDEHAEAVCVHEPLGGRVAQPERCKCRAERVVQLADRGWDTDPARSCGELGAAGSNDDGVHGPESSGYYVLGAGRVLIPDGEQWSSRDPVAAVVGKPERRRRDIPLLGLDRLVNQESEMATVVEFTAPVPMPDAHGERKPLQDDGVIGLSFTHALQPHRQIARNLGSCLSAHLVGGTVVRVSVGGDPNRARGRFLVEASGA